MKIDIESAVAAITSALHRGDIEPHDKNTERQVRATLDQAQGSCRLCGESASSGIHRDDNIAGHEFEPIPDYARIH